MKGYWKGIYLRNIPKAILYCIAWPFALLIILLFGGLAMLLNKEIEFKNKVWFWD